MKLILKDGQELTITRANDTYSYEGYKDGLGNDMNRNIVATISIFNSDKSLNTIKDMITDENRTGFNQSGIAGGVYQSISTCTVWWATAASRFGKSVSVTTATDDIR